MGAKILYNEQIIAELSGTQKATLPVANKDVEHDIIVENEESGGVDIAPFVDGTATSVDTGSATLIRRGCFQAFSHLTQASIPNITVIQDAGFNDTILLSSLTNADKVTSIGRYAFNGSGSEGEGLNLSFPNVITISDNAFEGSKIIAISLPSVKSIGQFAFHDVAPLSSISIPVLESLGSKAFLSCDSLILNELPSSIKEIGDYAFYMCSNLIISEIPASVTTISEFAFADCTGITSITFKGTPTTIGNVIFSGCSNLTTINVPWAEGTFATQEQRKFGAPNATINFNYIG